MANKKKTAIILGATGLTGNILLNKLLLDERYGKVIVLARKPLAINNSKLDVVQCNLLELDNVKIKFVADEVFCCIGTTTKKTPDKELYKEIDFGIPVNSAKLCKQNNIETFLVISSIGANANSSIFYSRTKGEMEEAVLEQNIKNTYILRPSIIGGNRNESRFTEKVSLTAIKIFNPLLVGSFRKYRTINAETIANAMINLANHKIDDRIIESDQIQLLVDSNQ